MKIVKTWKSREGNGQLDCLIIQLRDGSHLHVVDDLDASNGVRLMGARGKAASAANGLCCYPVAGNVLAVLTCPLSTPTTRE